MSEAITDQKLKELKAQVEDNMADAEVGPLLDHIDALQRQIRTARNFLYRRRLAGKATVRITSIGALLEASDE
ncbi:MAG: hypothetical protein U9Q07_04060 [Planctomycetota bacterium]|nr:hypothetical protein [Planctomycetota bacterium]